ncbi:hypothetical protein B0H13DRAFT_1899462 [Mycena leptocephala]|nr:hypothetical protein B0H13DRAFT_1899462 [Mycena leptocephala]
MSGTMAQNLDLTQDSLRKPHPHGVDLLRNRALDRPLGPFDGNVGAFAELGTQHYFITTNTDYVPTLPSIETPHTVYLRTDMRYGTDDPTSGLSNGLTTIKGARPELKIMWWDPSPADFVIGSTVTRGLRRLDHKKFQEILPPINNLVQQCAELRRQSSSPILLLFGELTQHILTLVEQLETLPTTFTKMLFALTLLQRAFLELDALYLYMTVYKKRMNDYYLAGEHRETGLAHVVGAFTTMPAIAQWLWAVHVPVWFLRPVEVFDRENILKVVALQAPQFDLPDPNAHGIGAPPVLYSGNSTVEKIAAIQRAAVHMPWYRDPFETSVIRARSPSPDPTAAATATVASTSHSVPPLSIPPSTGSGAAPRNHQHQQRFKPYSAKTPAKKGPAKIERDKFTAVSAPEMPPSIISMAEALAAVNRSVIPYTSSDADKRYVLPEPALFVTATPERRRKFLHHWNLLADGFIYMSTQQPNLLRPQWRDRGVSGTKRHTRSVNLQDCIRPVLEASGFSSVEGFPVPVEFLPEFTLTQIREIIWQVVEMSFRFEFCSLDKRASKRERLSKVKDCFAGHMLVGVPLEMSCHGWAAPTLEERHRYVARTATLMLDWTTKSSRPDIIRRVADRRQWSQPDMQALETAVCRYYTQAFWEYFGRAAVVPLRLDPDLEKEEGEL